MLGSYYSLKESWTPSKHKILAKKTMDQVVQIYGPTARDKIKPYYKKANISYPPKKVTFLAMKDEKLLKTSQHF